MMYDDEYAERMNDIYNSYSANGQSKKKAGRPAGSKNLKKKNKKEKKMYNNGLYGGTSIYGSKPFAGQAGGALLTGDDVVNITTSDSKRNRGYIFYMQKDLQSIYTKSGQNAVDNEFQVHYWFLNFRYVADDKSIIDIAIPTCYFNYEQFVTHGHVDFELKDVGPISEKLLPVHNMKVNELLAMEIDKKISSVFNDTLKFEAMSVNFGTMHRHPGASAHQNFSSTDLNVSVKTENDALGVVFPLADAEDDKPSFSAIIAMDGYANNKTANLAHCEYRVANGKIQTGLHYEKNRCIAFNVIPKEEPSVVERIFGAKSTRKSVVKQNNTDALLYEPEEKLLEIFEEIEKTWEASTHLVIPDNVKKPNSTVVVKESETRGTRAMYSYGFNEQDEFEAYGSFSGPIKNNTATSTTAPSGSVGTVSKKRTPHEHYLYAKQELTKIKNNNNFINTVSKYYVIENEQNYLADLELKFVVLNTLIEDFNIMSSLFYGNSHKDEEVRFYCQNGVVDYRDIRDFLNENITIACAIVDEVDANITILKAYEEADKELLRSTHLHDNPFQKAIDLLNEKLSHDNNTLDVPVDNAVETTTETTKEVVGENAVETTVTVTKEPEKEGLLSAVTKFMKGE